MNDFSKKDIIEILKDDSQNDWLFTLADETRKKYVGDEVHLRGLIEFSNYCKRECQYCGLNCTNKKIERYRILPENIIKIANQAVELGYKTIVLQSGEDNYYSKEIMSELIKDIKKLDVALTLSIGEKTTQEYEFYRKAGADRFLLRIETTDKKLYEKMHPHADFDNRIRCLKDIKEIGFEVGTGSLVGLPNQTLESLADDILFFKEIEADMVGVGPFISHPQTPLKNANNGNFTLALKVMALTRIILKDINIPATTAMETLHPDGRIIALKSGANVVMPNVTDIQYRAKYEIYPNKICLNDEPSKCRSCIEGKIKSIGRTIGQDKGFHRTFSS